MRGTLRRIRHRGLHLARLPLHRRLQRTKPAQKTEFLRLRENFAEHYSRLVSYDMGEFVVPYWRAQNAELERALLPRPPFGFLLEPVLAHNMFVTAEGRWLREELAFLEGKLEAERLRSLLVEDPVGCPLLSSRKYLTSHNSIHHLYHLVRYFEPEARGPEGIGTVVEWGAGYGNLTKVYERLTGGGATHILIDTPLLSCLQWLYLAAVFGESGVNLLLEPDSPICAHKINLLPLCFLDHHEITADLFISTWALSESSDYSIDYVAGRGWFKAGRLLLAFQEAGPKFPGAGRVGRLAEQAGALIEPIKFLRGSCYAFK